MPLPPLTMKDLCAICYKRPVVSLNRPHSLQKTKRLVRPNLGKWQGLWICARCRKAITKPEHIRKVNPPLGEPGAAGEPAAVSTVRRSTGAGAAGEPSALGTVRRNTGAGAASIASTANAVKAQDVPSESKGKAKA